MRRHPWLTAAIVFLVLCVAAFFCLEWRAEKRWQRYAAEARARGVRLMLADFAQPPIPDEQNFAMLPMLRTAFSDPNATPAFAIPQAMSHGADKVNRRTPWEGWPPFADAFGQNTIDWVRWQKCLREWGYLSDLTDQPAADVLRGLEHLSPEFQEWHQWRIRPYCRFPFDLTKPAQFPWPCIQLFRGATLMFALRMRAHLAVGDSAAAYADFQDGLQVYRALREQPLPIPNHVGEIQLEKLVSVVGSGLKDHAWADAECRKIEADLGRIRVWDDWALTLSTARANENTWQEAWMRTSLRERQRSRNFPETIFHGDLSNFVPRAWIRDTQLRENRYSDELLARIDLAQQTLNPNGPTPSSPSALTGAFDRYHYLFFYYYGVHHDRQQQAYASIATLLDQTRLACALEQFRTKHQVYPEKLEELTPEFIPKLPMDVYSRAAYHYQRVGETTFRLYGIGANGTDDGGQIVPGGYLQLDDIWPYAPPVSPAK